MMGPHGDLEEIAVKSVVHRANLSAGRRVERRGRGLVHGRGAALGAAGLRVGDWAVAGAFVIGGVSTASGSAIAGPPAGEAMGPGVGIGAGVEADAGAVPSAAAATGVSAA